jgi:hypothetical protein
VGGDASPTLVDLDDDGDLDALLCNGEGNTLLFANSGTSSAPAFAPPVTNPFGLADVGDGAAPAFGDVDGDGDLDAFVSEEEGDTFFFSNSGAATAPSFAAPLANPFGLASFEFDPAPALADLDDDGDLDVVLGRSDGNTLFFENTGTATAPALAAPLTNAFGLGDVGSDARPTFADIDGDRDLDAFVGRSDGHVIFFENLAALCPGAPDAGCTEGFAAGALSVNERKAGAEKLSLRLGKGPALTQADFGDPTASGGSAVALCIYDDAGAQVAALEVERAGELCAGKACWKSLGNPPPDGKGFAYKDAASSADGVRSLALKGGAAGKSSLAGVAGNKEAKGQTAMPTGIAAALQDATSVTLQVRIPDGACFSRTLTQITKQESALFKAK